MNGTMDSCNISVGETIAVQRPPSLNYVFHPIDAIDQVWFPQSANYDFSNNACQAGKDCGYYTQVTNIPTPQ